MSAGFVQLAGDAPGGPEGDHHHERESQPDVVMITAQNASTAVSATVRREGRTTASGSD